jgi:hypothetical protein
VRNEVALGGAVRKSPRPRGIETSCQRTQRPLLAGAASVTRSLTIAPGGGLSACSGSGPPEYDIMSSRSLPSACFDGPTLADGAPGISLTIVPGEGLSASSGSSMPFQERTNSVAAGRSACTLGAGGAAVSAINITTLPGGGFSACSGSAPLE